MVRTDRNGQKGEFKKTTPKDIVYFILPFVSIGLLLLLWYRVSSITSLFPGMVQTYERFLLLLEKPIMRVPFYGHILASLKRVVIALLAAIVLGIAFGTLIGWNKKCDSFFGTVFNFILGKFPKYFLCTPSKARHLSVSSTNSLSDGLLVLASALPERIHTSTISLFFVIV